MGSGPQGRWGRGGWSWGEVGVGGGVEVGELELGGLGSENLKLGVGGVVVGGGVRKVGVRGVGWGSLRLEELGSGGWGRRSCGWGVRSKELGSRRLDLGGWGRGGWGQGN